MVQLEGCSLDQRKTILNIFEEKGEITDKELSEVMGTEVGGLFDMRTTLLNSQYKASLMGQTLQEFTAEAKAYDLEPADPVHIVCGNADAFELSDWKL